MASKIKIASTHKIILKFVTRYQYPYTLINHKAQTNRTQASSYKKLSTAGSRSILKSPDQYVTPCNLLVNWRTEIDWYLSVGPCSKLFQHWVPDVFWSNGMTYEKCQMKVSMSNGILTCFVNQLASKIAEDTHSTTVATLTSSSIQRSVSHWFILQNEKG